MNASSPTWDSRQGPLASMKSHKWMFVVIGVMFVTEMLNAGNQYPMFQGKVEREIDEKAYEAELLSSYPLFKKLGQPGAKAGIPAEEIDTQLKKAASSIALKAWPAVAADGKMLLPQVLIQEGGIIGGLDNMFLANALSASEQEQSHMEAYAVFWRILIDQHPQRAFALMAKRATTESVTTIDVLHVTASIGQSPGNRRLSALPSKADWEALHQSKNPCYRFLALEFFDSVPQSPDDLLWLYRECLFGACGYMEGRALEAINRNEDYREAVAKLLEAYVAANPLLADGTMLDDGTIPRLRDHFYDRIRNSKEFVTRIRDYIAKNGEKMPTAVSPTGKTSTQPVNRGDPAGASHKKPQATVDTVRPAPAGTSQWWLVTVGAVIAAVGLLWLLLKKRPK